MPLRNKITKLRLMRLQLAHHLHQRMLLHLTSRPNVQQRAPLIFPQGNDLLIPSTRRLVISLSLRKKIRHGKTEKSKLSDFEVSRDLRHAHPWLVEARPSLCDEAELCWPFVSSQCVAAMVRDGHVEQRVCAVLLVAEWVEVVK
jgi:hypothetical protein